MSTTSPNDGARPNFYDTSTELNDLGRERYDQDTAAVGDRDYALFARGPVNVRQGRVPAGLESQVFAWNTFKYTTEETNEREELKGNLHEGQLHRQNRAALAAERGPDMFAGPRDMGMGRGGGLMSRGIGGKRGKNGKGGGQDQGRDSLCAGRKPDYPAPPQAKGFPEELDKSFFWDEPIV